jgi:hypothetical protein
MEIEAKRLSEQAQRALTPHVMERIRHADSENHVEMNDAVRLRSYGWQQDHRKQRESITERDSPKNKLRQQQILAEQQTQLDRYHQLLEAMQRERELQFEAESHRSQRSGRPDEQGTNYRKQDVDISTDDEGDHNQDGREQDGDGIDASIVDESENEAVSKTHGAMHRAVSQHNTRNRYQGTRPMSAGTHRSRSALSATPTNDVRDDRISNKHKRLQQPQPHQQSYQQQFQQLAPVQHSPVKWAWQAPAPGRLKRKTDRVNSYLKYKTSWDHNNVNQVLKQSFRQQQRTQAEALRNKFV